MPAYYALILRSLTVLEGLALQADPKYKLLGRAYPYMARRLLTDPAPELRSSFEDLVIKVGVRYQGSFEECAAGLYLGIRRRQHGVLCLHLLLQYIVQHTCMLQHFQPDKVQMQHRLDNTLVGQYSLNRHTVHATALIVLMF